MSGALTNETTLTHCAMILQFMRDYGSITPAQAIEEIGCYRLGARIFDLRKAGHKIKTDAVERKNRYGKTVRFARYSIVKENEDG